ncbi:methyltransferase family protein [Maribacter vaceletii]|uniref:Methyltransferase family protein n=1 Tax=Maribacter vaceletii TaxID=1206816 RepID=A0A495EDS7_9FLAO|nr:class I SAM-dependent methyltransferase [Maribacter vaceletii]RKR14801.1 methyltransferase family protein [Maribacter vaceletii]
MKLYLKTKDFLITGEEFQLEHDSDLDMLVTKPQPNNLDMYYESDAYISHSDASISLLDKIYQVVKKYSIQKKVSLINSYRTSDKNVLDVGAGTGDFLLGAKNGGWQVCGMEPNSNAITKASEKGITLYSDFTELKNKKFNVITLWHVLEHLPNLEEQIQNLKKLLAENGTLIIAVPNYKSFDAKWYKENWAAYDVPRHLWHFSRTSISKLFSSHSMKVVKTKPMWFDSFYVSILSEEHQPTKKNIFRAFMVGLWSNLKAVFTKEYSSVIYILKNA